MKVIYYEVGEEPKLIEVQNKLEDLQRLVDGYIETMILPNGLIIVCNEEGKLRGLPINRVVRGEPIAGNFFVCRSYGEDFSSVTSNDIELLLA